MCLKDRERHLVGFFEALKHVSQLTSIDFNLENPTRQTLQEPENRFIKGSVRHL